MTKKQFDELIARLDKLEELLKPKRTTKSRNKEGDK